METPKTIQTILAHGESAHVAFKPATVTVEVLGKTICAFLNSGGGQILVGVNEEGRVEGDVSAKKIEQMLRELSGGGPAGGLITPNAVWDISEEHTQHGTVALIDVPSGSDLPYVFRDGIYVRVGATARQATGSETRTLIEKRFAEGVRWERRPAPEIKLSELDAGEIRKTATAAMHKRGWTFRDPDDLMAILEDLKLTEQGRITNAAVILFAKQAGDIFPQAQVRMTAYRTDKIGEQLPGDHLSKGHLFSILEDYDAFVRRHVSVASDFSAGNPAREDSPVFPYWALREGFRNALMHRDYSSHHGRVSVSIHTRRIEIWSFGGLPNGLTIKSLKNVDRSLPVNPDIAQVVFLRGLVELLGRGTRKIVEEFRSWGLPEPSWKEHAGGITLSMRGANHLDRLPEQLNARQIDLLRRMRPGSATTIAKIRRESKKPLSERTARNDVAGLIERKFFVRQGQGKSTFYVRTEKPIA